MAQILASAAATAPLGTGRLDTIVTGRRAADPHDMASCGGIDLGEPASTGRRLLRFPAASFGCIIN
jgi:hypothetical protein